MGWRDRLQHRRAKARRLGDAEPTGDGAEATSVVIYTTMLCPFCHRAKRLLSHKGVPFTEIDVTLDRSRRAEMTERAGGRSTVPQIFVGERRIGDCDEIHALERQGKLDQLLHPA